MAAGSNRRSAHAVRVISKRGCAVGVAKDGKNVTSGNEEPFRGRRAFRTSGEEMESENGKVHLSAEGRRAYNRSRADYGMHSQGIQ